MKTTIKIVVLCGLFLTVGCGTPAGEVTTAASTPQPAPTEAPPTEIIVLPTSTPRPTKTPPPPPTIVPEPVLFTPVNPPDQPMLPPPEAGSPFESIYTDAGAVVYRDGLFHLFYNTIHSWPPREILVGYATSADGLTWTRQGDEPVLLAEEVSYAGHTLLASNVFVEDDGTWVMYFYTWPAMSAVVQSAIGRATAPAPAGPWTPDETPALEASPDSWDPYSVANPYVVRHDNGTYYMYYTGHDSANRTTAIGLATSADGLTWTKHDGPVLQAGDATWSESRLFGPKVLPTENGWLMIYRNDPMSGIPMTLSYATSEDGLTWTHMTQDTPIFDIGPTAEWRAIWATDIAYVDGTYFLFAEIGTGSSTDVHVMTYEGTFGQ